MIYNLWKYLLQDDVENFRQYLARATYTHSASRATSAATTTSAFKIGSPSAQATSPKTPKQRKNPLLAPAAGRATGLVLSRADINAKDSFGRTILHHAASSLNKSAIDFVKALLDIPLLDLYIQDLESGWTALHRALYVGNIEIAYLLITRDIQNATDYTTSAPHGQFGGLIKIKDHEGNSPFEVFGSTIAPRSLQHATANSYLDAAESESVNSVDVSDDPRDGERRPDVSARINVQGDEVFAFGSNKNLSLGLGDEDDRQFPERVFLQRPDHVLRYLYDAHLAKRQERCSEELLVQSYAQLSDTEIPRIIRSQPIIVQDVVMSKMHTAILTCDPLSNLFVCGFGPGGRLGTGDESTRFDYVCVQGGGLAKRKVSAIALGHYHTIAICSSGEVFTWGSNKYGQLGYALPEVTPKEVPMQLTPRQVYGLVKKEQIIGAAASAIHSVIYSASALWTFGKNEGQLGLVDADARSLDVQVIPRRVGASILQSPIKTVSSIDRATTVLMENNDVIVFTHFAWKKVIFPFEEASNLSFTQALRTRYSKEPNTICKVTSGGNTICALSTFGQVFTVNVPQESERVPSNVSTTNPNKARNALPQPSRIWSIGKPHMSAVDVAVGQDGSIILCTNSGSVLRKEKRAQIKSIHAKLADSGRAKDYKFIRVPNLTRTIAVRSNAFGAFAAVRKDCDVTREQMLESPPTLWHDMFPLLSFHKYGKLDPSADEYSDEPVLRFWDASSSSPSPSLIKRTIFSKQDAENDFLRQSTQTTSPFESSYDVWITSNVTEVRIPVHSCILKARSRVLRSALAEFATSYFFSIPDIMSIEYGTDGRVQVKFLGADFLTLANYVFYLYTDNVVDVWAPTQTAKSLSFAPRYRQVRVELMKIAAALEMRQLEKAVRLMVDPANSMATDFEAAYLDLDFWAHADVVIDLADEAETPAHSVLLCARCPFFDGLFHGRAGGMWTSARKGDLESSAEPFRVDLKHVDENVFLIVLRHIYADTGDELFDDLITEDIDQFIDIVIDVTFTANELMLDRLAEICQAVLGRYVTVRNVCGLLNSIAECSVSDFKIAALEYICLNLESMLELRLLEELEDYLMAELNEVVRQNQLAYMPIVRSGRVEAELIDRNPQLAEALEKDRLIRIDSMKLPSRLTRDDERVTPKRKAVVADDEMPFRMDEDPSTHSPKFGSQAASPSIRPMTGDRRTSALALSTSVDSEENFVPGSIDTELLSGSMSSFQALSSPPAGTSVNKLKLPEAAWKSSPSHKDSRIDFKQIMEQTTTSRVSNLTQAMTTASATSVKAAPRMSQKERKKQQQEMKRYDSAGPERRDEPAVGSSPWTKVVPTPPTVALSPSIGESPRNKPNLSPAPGRPGMTMRQTVAGSPTINAAPTRSHTNVSNGLAVSTLKPTPPQIHSIRHIPTASRSTSLPDARSSMADILSQQQGEKLAIQDAAAKRSLQEIQQEQEFQEWWDQESRRVQDEEARTVGVPARQAKSGRSGRSTRKRGSGRAPVQNPGLTASDAKDAAEPQRSHEARGTATSTANEGSNDRGRGHGRRGRGRPRPRGPA